MRIFSIFIAAFILIQSSTSNAQMGDWFESQDAKARLIAGSGNKAALQINLADGWHTYWRVSGDSGLPPIMSWADSQNIESLEIQWPAPKRKIESGFHIFGYDGRLTLPFEYSKKDLAEKASLNLKAQIMICKDICIPEKFEISVEIDPRKKPHETNKIIETALEKVPKTEIDDMSIDSIVIAEDSFLMSVTSQNGFKNMSVFPVIEEDQLGLITPPKIEISDLDQTKAVFRIHNGMDHDNLAEAMREKTLSVVLKHGDKAIKKSIQY
ncbi:MAG: protein-disulfide reductase DsbD domain-containing protein [Bdellovibrionales bacterium]